MTAVSGSKPSSRSSLSARDNSGSSSTTCPLAVARRNMTAKSKSWRNTSRVSCPPTSSQLRIAASVSVDSGGKTGTGSFNAI